MRIAYHYDSLAAGGVERRQAMRAFYEEVLET